MVLLKVADIAEIYGVTKYEAQNIMNSVAKINVGRSMLKPRWRTTAEAVEKYIATSMNRSVAQSYGLDKNGKILRR